MPIENTNPVKKIENNGQEKKFHEREIWWCSLGENIGFEEDGKHDNFERPILVLRKFNSGMFLGLPLTSKKHQDIFHSGFTLKLLNENNELEEKESFAILSQLRILSSKRMVRRVVIINEKTFSKIKDDFMRLMSGKQNGPLSGSSGA